MTLIGDTYFLDIDGTLVPHLTNEQIDLIMSNKIVIKEELLVGVKELWTKFKKNDVIIITTARRESHRELTTKIFTENNLRYDNLIMNLPSGQRVLINDSPDIFYKKAISINVKRNQGFYFDASASNEDDSGGNGNLF